MHLLCVLTAVAIFLGNGQISRAHRVEFYAHQDYSGFIKETDVTKATEKDCFELVNPGKKEIRSIKTDKCLMVFTNSNCKLEFTKKPHFNYLGESYRVDRNTPDLVKVTESKYPIVASFRLCSEQYEGGPTVNVDFYDEGQLQGPVVEEYKDVCGCRNLPLSYIAGKSREVSINNYGHRLEVFEKEHCQGRSVVRPAGKNHLTFFVFPPQYHNLFDIRSFRPLSPLPCMKLNAEIQKFNINSSTIGDLMEEDLKVAKEDSAINDSDGKATKRYSISERVTETLQYSIAQTWTEMNSVGVSTGFEVTGGLNLPVIASAKMRQNFAADYRWTKTDGQTTTQSKTTVNDITISGDDSMEIPPCRRCHISNYIKTLTKPVAYTAIAYVTGVAGEDKVSATEIRVYLPEGATAIRDIDEYTVEVRVEDKLKAKYGTSAYTEITCDPIQSCLEKFGLPNPGQEKSTQALPVSRHDA